MLRLATFSERCQDTLTVTHCGLGRIKRGHEELTFHFREKAVITIST